MNAKEQQRGTVLNRMERGGLTGQQAARLMGLSLRQVRRLLAAYRKDGVAALAHGNRGRSPLHRIHEETRDMVVELARGPYRGFNHYQLQKELAEREGLHLSRSSLWRILTGAKVPSSRRRRKAQYRQRRERYPQEGMLLQVDGSRHDWLQGRGPYLTLVGAVDDATDTVPFALFRQQEDAHGYMLMLKDIIDHHGVPLALYSDRHGIFQRSPKESESLEEQLRGRRDPTQFGRALEELDIRLILAHTPQAKGRIERVWGSFQDRLVSEMRLAGASTIEQANQVLWNFLPRFNQRFGVTSSQPGSAYRQLPPGVSLNATLCFKYIRTVANDNTVRFNGATIQLLADDHRASYARAKVEVQERLDGSIVVAYRGRTLAAEPAATEPVTLRARSGRRANGHWTADVAGSGSNDDHLSPTTKTKTNSLRRPAPNHPWRR